MRMPRTPAVADTAPLIDVALAAFMTGGVSIGMASVGPNLRPSMARAVGCRLSEDLRQVTLLASAASAPELLADLRAGGPIAALFSLPSTHRTVQLKAPSTRLAPATPAGWALATRYVQAFTDELARLGWSIEFVTALLTWQPGDLMAISFEPVEAYDQTPGANAGTPLVPGGARS